MKRQDILRVAADVINALGAENKALTAQVAHLDRLCAEQADRIATLRRRVDQLEAARRNDSVLLAIVGGQWRDHSTGGGEQ